MRALAAVLLAATMVVACRPGPPAASPAGAAAETGGSSGPGAPCYGIVTLSVAQRRLECVNGDSFTLRLAADGKWYPEMKVRAGAVPGHASPQAAGKALCACP